MARVFLGVGSNSDRERHMALLDGLPRGGQDVGQVEVAVIGVLVRHLDVGVLGLRDAQVLGLADLAAPILVVDAPELLELLCDPLDLRVVDLDLHEQRRAIVVQQKVAQVVAEFGRPRSRHVVLAPH